MPLLIAEELFLLTHDEESGKSKSGSLAPDAATAGALLLDLAEHGAMQIGERKRVLATDEVLGHPLLERTRAAIADDGRQRSVSHWVNRLSRKLRPMQERVGDALVDRGILGREDRKVLGMFSSQRWPERDPQPERDLRAGLVAVLARGATPTPRQELLVPLLTAQNLINKIVDKHDRRAGRQTAKTMAKAAKNGQLVSATVSQTVQATQTAVLMTILAGSVAATTASTSS